MRIQQLRLEAFGCFTEKTLNFDLSPSNHDIHIIYGPNEAGKSTSLRALTGWLFGIEDRTADTFMHQAPQLRVGGVLQHSNGNTLNFSRRKGRKNTLIGEGGQPLQQGELSSFLNGVTVELFQHLLGIDHASLIQGGEEILRQQGEVGKALFAAVSGQKNIDQLLLELKNEANALYLARGSKQKINQNIGVFRSELTSCREAMLPARDWEEKQTELDTTERKLLEIQNLLKQVQQDLVKFRRLQHIQPKVSARQHQVDLLEQLTNVPLLPAGFSKRRIDLQAELTRVIHAKEAAELQAKKLQNHLDAIQLDRTVDSYKERVEALFAQQSKYRQCVTERPELKAQIDWLKAQIDSLQVRLGYSPDIFLQDKLNLVLARRQSLMAIVKQGDHLRSLVLPLQQALAINQAKLENLESNSVKEPSCTAQNLLHLIADASRQGDLENRLEQTRQRVDELEKQYKGAYEKLCLPPLKKDSLLTLRLPTEKQIKHFENEFDQLEQRRSQLEAMLNDASDRKENSKANLEKLTQGSELPTLAQLEVMRLNRDDLLSQLQVVKEPAESDFQPLWLHLNKVVIESDHLVDRLFSESERVHQAEHYKAEIAHLEAKCLETHEQIKVCQQLQKKFNAEWAGLWSSMCDITPDTPREMNSFLYGFERLRELLQLLMVEQKNHVDLGAHKDQHSRALIAELKKTRYTTAGLSSLTLDGLIERADKWAAELLQQESKWQQFIQESNALKIEIKQQKAQSEQLLKANNDCQQEWIASVRACGIEIDLAPADLDDFTNGVRELLEYQKDLDRRIQSLQKTSQQIDQFCHEANQLIVFFKYEKPETSAEEKLLYMQQQLQTQLELHTRYNQYLEQQTQTMEQIELLELQLARLNVERDEICQLAGCEQLQQIEGVEQKALQKGQARAQLENLEHEIIKAGNGLSLNELIIEAGSVAGDLIPGEISRLEHQYQEILEPERIELVQERGSLLKELEFMNGSDNAARSAEKAQGLLAEIRQDAEQFIRLKLAIQMLENQIESYRQTHQGPLLKFASQVFKALTLNSFEHLKVEFDGNDQPVLAGIRSDKTSVHVDGMSSGTRDQLFLSLRLAAIDQYRLKSEAMPFIVDDILIEFDDQRSFAALEQLHHLAEQSQVLVFTHHQRIIEQAESLKNIRCHHL